MNRYTMRGYCKPFFDERSEVYLTVPSYPHIFHSPTALTDKMIMLGQRRVVPGNPLAQEEHLNFTFLDKPLQVAIDGPQADVR